MAFDKRNRTEPSTRLEVLKEVSIDEVSGTLVQRGIDGDDITLRDEILEIFYSGSIDCLLSLRGKTVVIVVKKALGVEGLQTLKHTVANSASADGTDYLALKVERIASDVGDLPITALDHLYRCR